jgi:hypothetical protein
MKTNTSIDIDLDVYKAIVNHSNYINEPANDVLKRLLAKTNVVPSLVQKSHTEDHTSGITVKGIFLKSGLKLRKHFKGTLFEAVVRNGHIEFNSKRYTSPSGAAVVAAKGSVNGWRFWDFLDDNDGKWKLLELLRNK